MAALAPTPVPTGSEIPTYDQVPETTFERRSMCHYPTIHISTLEEISMEMGFFKSSLTNKLFYSRLGRPRYFGSVTI
jgi:hypothetical protein